MLIAILATAALVIPGAALQTTSMTGKVRIVAIGDSTTAGTPAFLSPIEAPPDGRGDPQSQYPYWLMKTHPGWEVLNRGVNGERSDQILDRFERDAIAEKPIAVVILAGVNDVYQGRSVDHVTRQLRLMYSRASRAGVRVVAGSIIPFNTATPEQNRRMHAINDWIRREAEGDANVDHVDTRAAVSAPGRPDMLVSSPDELHPSVDGYRRMADAIGPVLEAVLAR